MNSGFTLPSRRLKLAARLTRWLLWLAAGAWLVFALSWGVLHAVIVPRIDSWRPELESLATRSLGVKVRIGEIRAESTGFIPAFELRDVRLFDQQEREALHLPSILSAVSAQSLWRLGFEQLLIQAPVLDVRRTADGRIQVAGMDVSRTSPEQDGNALVDWFFSQTEFAIRGGRLRWTDEMRPDAPPLELQGLDLVVRNPGRQHLLRLDATPPAEWGERFSLRGQFRQPLWVTDASRWREWNGTLYGDFTGIDLRHLHEYLDMSGWLGTKLHEGKGALRLWADVQRGEVRGITSDLALTAVKVQLGDKTPLALHDLQGRLSVRHGGQEWQFASENLAFRTLTGVNWPGGNIRYGHTVDKNGQLQAMQLQADRLDLDLTQALASHLPFDEWVHQGLHDLRPHGLVETLDVQWRPGKWEARGRVNGLALAAAPAPPAHTDDKGTTRHPLGRPGLQGARLDFDAHQGGGKATITLKNGSLDFPGMFEDPRLVFDELEAEATWTHKGDDIDVELPRLRFANADAQGEARGRWHTSDPRTSPSGSRFPGVLELTATLNRANGARVHRYLPQEIPESVRRYVRDAVRQGQARDARFVVKGDLWEFPFERPGSGNFDVRARLGGVQFAYVPEHLLPAGGLPWPALDDVAADLHIDRASLHIGGASGRVSASPQLRASQADARIANFMEHSPRLVVQAQVTGPATDALAFVNRSPLLGMTGEALRRATITGPADVRFELDLPLDKVDDTQVKGVVRFTRNDIRVTPETPWLEGATGLLQFNEKGFQLSQASARALGGDLRFSGAMQARPAGDGTVRFQGQGTASAEGLRNLRDGGWLAQLGQHTSGSTSYQIRLGFTPDGTDVLVESSLLGLASRLPEPLAKEASQVLPLRFDISSQTRDNPNAPQRDRLSLELGGGNRPVLSARYEREHISQGTRVLRGAIALRSERPDMPANGVQAQLALGDLDVQAWERALAGNGAAAPDMGDTRAYWPTSFGLEATRIHQDGRHFHDVVAGGSREGDTWRLNVNARELNGYVEFRPTVANTPGRVYARLARLTLPPAATSGVENLLQSPPQHVPALDIVVNNFELNNRSLGKLEIEAVNRTAALSASETTREWRLTKLNLSVPEARLEATGNWAAMGAASQGMGGARRTALTLRLGIEDSGALLTRFGMPGVIRGGKGQIEGTLGWVGSPLGLHYPSLGGTLAVDVQRGQFLKADPGLAKLLGVLSLQALPRRLTLDFRDVFSEGFAFDFVRGNVRIEQGVANTNNLQMKGVNAAVLLEGSADLARETQDITAVVVPELNAGTAALVASAINPAVGLGTFLAQFLLGKPLQAAATQHFHITGTWNDPQIEKVNARNIAPEGPTPQKERGQP
ncbi:YhdP family protein [Hydrogenophaga aquatica]